MAYDRFLIGPINSGLQTNVKPFMLPDDAFAELTNVYVFRERVQKRPGTELMGFSGTFTNRVNSSRFRVNVGTTDGAGAFGPTAILAGMSFSPGQMFSIGDVLYTMTATGSPATFIQTDGGTSTITFDTATRDLTLAAALALTDIYFYPGLPVMGLSIHEEQAINDEISYGFDTRYAYQFIAGSWQRLTGGTDTWLGTDTMFFWSTNYRGASAQDTVFFTTNYNTTTPESMRYYNGTWNVFSPIYDSAQPLNIIITARIIIAFKNRLLLLNTYENINGVGNRLFVNRVRWSQVGNPIAMDSFYQLPGKGSFEDAPTKEAIVSAQIIKDRLIVFFERSTWELVYTSNQVSPFIWQKINTELGAESTFSIVPFDKVLIGVGQTGIHACNGANVERIDQKIPDTVFDLLDVNQGPTRVQGIRDFFTEVVYWTFPDEAISTESRGYPQQVLLYNYQNRSWAFITDSFTTFGYYQKQNDETWSSTELTWEEYTGTWAGINTQEGSRQVIAGNQQGFVLILDRDITSNEVALLITDLTYTASLVTLVVYNHNMQVGEYFYIQNAQGVTALNDFIFQVESITDPDIFTFIPVDENGDPIVIAGVYTGGGFIGRVSNLNILTKQYNPYQKEGKNVYISQINFNLDKTAQGEVTVDYFPSFTNLSMVESATSTGCILGTSILETKAYTLVPLESQAAQVWHSLYLQTDGECIQLRIYMSDHQMRVPEIAFSDFQLNAMVLYSIAVGRLQ